MRKIVLILGLSLVFSLSGFSQEPGQSSPTRLKLVPVKREASSSTTNVPVEQKTELTTQEKIEKVEQMIASIESKIEVLVSEDPEANAVEIAEKRAELEKYKLELTALKSGQD